jgi:N-acetylglucosaminyldiphosphoundecaprenol N-acetyl-beta-D-mannosaminyltransferase
LAVPTERVVESATNWLEGRAASVDFLGIPVCTLDLQGAVDLIDSAIRARQGLQIGVINAAKVANMATDPVLRDAVLSSDVIFADGISVVWASRLLGAPLPARVAGIDLMMALLVRGKERRYRVFCLGATEAISARRHHGYYSNEDETKVVELIAAARPDLLFVAMTSPKKENFLAKWGARLNTLVTHGVGGSFDVLAGHVQRAPRAWQALGLEWLYRVLQEPRRLWKRYFVTNIAFCGLVGRALIGRLVRRRT